MAETERCFQCGALCYADGIGDDVIPAGYWNKTGEFLCEFCFTDEDEEEYLEAAEEARGQ